mmetsp:Transcript_12457/g.29194  ORF Transcript_12457/g.29194 Transcript_12457/m.29194 type:complete len:82 (+) Transcript_12457:253-498(+)
MRLLGAECIQSNSGCVVWPLLKDTAVESAVRGEARGKVSAHTRAGAERRRRLGATTAGLYLRWDDSSAELMRRRGRGEDIS